MCSIYYHHLQSLFIYVSQLSTTSTTKYTHMIKYGYALEWGDSLNFLWLDEDVLFFLWYLQRNTGKGPGGFNFSFQN